MSCEEYERLYKRALEAWFEELYTNREDQVLAYCEAKGLDMVESGLRLIPCPEWLEENLEQAQKDFQEAQAAERKYWQEFHTELLAF